MINYTVLLDSLGAAEKQFFLSFRTPFEVTRAAVAMLGDITLSEPRARVGFAGPRVIEKTLNQKLPEGFQKAERVLECGFIDAIVPRQEQREYLDRILSPAYNYRG